MCLEGNICIFFLIVTPRDAFFYVIELQLLECNRTILDMFLEEWVSYKMRLLLRV